MEARRTRIAATLIVLFVLLVINISRPYGPQAVEPGQDPERPCSYIKAYVDLYHVAADQEIGPYQVIDCDELGDITGWPTPETPGETVEVLNDGARHLGVLRPADNIVIYDVDWQHVLVRNGGINAFALNLRLVEGSNVLQNPSFEGGEEPWIFFGGGVAEFLVTEPGYQDAYAARVSITGEGSNIQLYQYNLELEPHTEYRLSFAAQSNTGHDLSVVLHKHSSPYTRYGLDYREFDITTEWQMYSVDFVTVNFEGPVSDARFRFWFATLGVEGDIYWIDDVSLSPIVEEPPTVTPEPPTEAPTITATPTPTATSTPTLTITPTITVTPTPQLTHEHSELVDRITALETRQAEMLEAQHNQYEWINWIEMLLIEIADLILSRLGP